MWEPDDPQQEQAMLWAAQSDPARFAPLYERYAPRVYAYCLNRVDNLHDAEDLTSQTFVRAITAVSHYRGGLAGAWLFSIATHVMADYWRTKPGQYAFDPITSVGGKDQLLDQVVRNDEQAALHQIISTLPDDQQQMLSLRLYGELSAEEIGAVMGKSAGAIRTALHRTLKHIAKLYHAQEKQEKENIRV